ncbi:MAG: KH domain-containing protein [Candidatus Odinarchaeia archaeon]
MSRVEYLKVPKDRVAVIIGKKGETKKLLEKLTHSNIEVDSKNNTVKIEPSDENTDPLLFWKTKFIILAIARGFSPQNALKLLQDDILLEIIDLDRFTNSKKSKIRIKGRIIGENGKTRRTIEELSECKISVYGDTISIIGDQYAVRIAKHAITMLINGYPHSAVYRYLNKKKQELKQRKYDLWEKIPLKTDEE